MLLIVLIFFSFRLPHFSVIIVIFGEFLYLLLQKLNVVVGFTLISLFATFILLVRYAIKNKSLSRIDLKLIYLTLIIISSSVIGIQNYSIVEVLLGLKVFIFPIVIHLIFKSLEYNQLRLISKIFFILFSINLVFAMIEYNSTALEFLTNNSYFHYGTNIRELNGHIRAPGLMRTNVYLGMTSAYFLLGLITFGFSNKKLISKSTAILLAIITISLLILSISRTSLVIILVGLTTIAYRNRKFGYKLILTLASTITFVLYLGIGGVSTDSFFARIRVWRLVISDAGLLGHGLGSFGSSTFSRFYSSSFTGADSTMDYLNFSDNNYLSLIFQFGYFPAICLLVIIAIWMRNLYKLSGAKTRSFILSVFFASVVAAFVTDIWEYWPALGMCSFWFQYAKLEEGEFKK